MILKRSQLNSKESLSAWRNESLFAVTQRKSFGVTQRMSFGVTQRKSFGVTQRKSFGVTQRKSFGVARGSAAPAALAAIQYSRCLEDRSVRTITRAYLCPFAQRQCTQARAPVETVANELLFHSILPILFHVFGLIGIRHIASE